MSNDWRVCAGHGLSCVSCLLYITSSQLFIEKCFRKRIKRGNFVRAFNKQSKNYQAVEAVCMREYCNASFVNKERNLIFSKEEVNCDNLSNESYNHRFVEEYSPMAEWRGGGEGEFIVY